MYNLRDEQERKDCTLTVMCSCVKLIGVNCDESYMLTWHKRELSERREPQLDPAGGSC